MTDYFFIYGGLGPHLVALWRYSWLCEAWGTIWEAGYRTQVYPRLVSYKVNALQLCDCVSF